MHPKRSVVSAIAGGGGTLPLLHRPRRADPGVHNLSPVSLRRPSAPSGQTRVFKESEGEAEEKGLDAGYVRLLPAFAYGLIELSTPVVISDGWIVYVKSHSYPIEYTCY